MQIAIMQPTYLPWLGYFALYDTVEKFVLLDDVQFEYQSWQHRNRIKTPNNISYLTVPIDKQSRKLSIEAVRIANTVDWRSKQLSQLRESYRKAPFFTEVMQLVEEVFNQDIGMISLLNVAFLRRINEYLGLSNDRLVLNSSLSVGGAKVERLVNICQELGADQYLSPPGSFGYIDEDNQLERQGISVKYLGYGHPEYKQLHGDFVSHLSIIDLLMNEGERSLEIIRNGEVSSIPHTEMKANVEEDH